jgi:hypothetical protein
MQINLFYVGICEMELHEATPLLLSPQEHAYDVTASIQVLPLVNRLTILSAVTRGLLM